MREISIEVFDQTRDARLLRLVEQDGSIEERLIDRAVIETLVGTVTEQYRSDSVEVRSTFLDKLVSMGQGLWNFLDGEERWLVKALGERPDVLLRITTTDNGLRHLPWEVLADGDSYLSVDANHRFTPVREVTKAKPGTVAEVANRPLRVLFMASSPEDTEPVLDFEAEEAMILASTAESGIELVVEESGTLEGLRSTVEFYGEGYFDVLHLSGHAEVDDNQPLFVLEDELGFKAKATPAMISQAMRGLWPRIVFVSGCTTGGAPDLGAVPSMSESLVEAGAPTVLGWSLPVGDRAASLFAASLYRDLGAGRKIGEAICHARYELYAERNRYWHFLRVYADSSPLDSIVTPAGTHERPAVPVTEAAAEFLDPITGLIKVASRQQFVGRRRLIQRSLHHLRAPIAQPETSQGIVLQGMGGLGKSTLASRLVERMPTHRRTVLVGRIDEAAFRQMISRIDFGDLAVHQEAVAIANAPGAGLTERLRYLLAGPMATIPAVFVFDDFEEGNLEERDGTHVCSPDANEVIGALLNAIRLSNGRSRVIITSRYRFPVPQGAHLHFEALETFNSNEQRKKLNDLQFLRADSSVDKEIRDRAIDVASGNPRLLEWLNRVAGDNELDTEALLSAIEGTATEFREDILADELLRAQPAALRTMLARVNVVDLPVPRETVQAICGDQDVAGHIDRAAALGLLEVGLDPQNRQPRYLVSNVLRPLLTQYITDDERRDSCAAAAESLHKLWIEDA